MPIVPVRGIAKAGVITDVDAYNLPIGAWSFGNNVRFRNQSITRSPVLRSAYTTQAAPPTMAASFTTNAYAEGLVTQSTEAAWLTAVSGTFTRALTADYTNSSGLLASAATGVIRFDYDPVLLTPKGLLLEGASTNSAVQSNGFLAAAWTVQSGTIVQNAVGPDGVSNSAWTYTSAGGAVTQCFSATSLAASTISIYAKAGTASYILLGKDGSAYTYFNVATGTVGSVGSGFSNASITLTDDGYYRCSVFVSGSITFQNFAIADANGTPGCASGHTMSIYGFAIEPLASATSYIPTTTVAVTRPADNLHYPFVAPTQFSRVVSFITPSWLHSNNTVWSLDDGTTNNGFYLYLQTSNSHLILLVVSGGVTQASLDLGAVALSTAYTVTLAAKATSFRASLSGGAVVSVSAGSMPVLTTERIGYSLISGSEWYGWVKSIKNFDGGFATDAQLIAGAPSFTEGMLNASPRFLAADVPSSGFDSVIVGYLNGRVSSLVSGVETDASISAYTPSSAENVYTSCHLGDVYYVNRGDRAPWALLPTSSTFEVLPNWAPVSGPWTADILRASNSALCAYGVTQNGVYSPNMVITSEFTIVDTVPTSWDYTIGTNNATQTVLGEMEGPITDACALGSIIVIYGQNETWVQYLSGDANIWKYDLLFSDRGAINANCAVEVDKKHYVFGLNDIWVHDGNSPMSICDERTREFIFGYLNVASASRCAVTYNKNLKELYFRYMSSDPYCSFSSGADGCNRQAVYHIPSDTWSFDDLPFVFGATMANMDSTATWATIGGTWATVGGTWASQGDSVKKVMTMVGDVNAQYNLTESVYAFDLEGQGSLVALPVDTNATMGWTLIHDGLDLDQIGADLRGYKLISTIYPRLRMETNAVPVSFSFGSADYFNQPVTMSAPQTYDGNTLYKLDYNAAGRYLLMNITHNDYHAISFTGFDVDLDVLGEW